MFQRYQYPVRAAFAMTVNKSQGQTLDKVRLYLPRPLISHGQLYVAFSKVGSWDAIKVLIAKGGTDGLEGVYTHSILFGEVLQQPQRAQ